MTPSTDLTRAIRKALSTERPCPPRTASCTSSRAPDPNNPTPDADWAIREIVDQAMFETAR